MSDNWFSKTRIKRLKAAEFLARNSFPSMRGREFTHEKNKISEVINYAINAGDLEQHDTDDFDTVAFFRWASEKNKTKSSSELRWPWLEQCLNLPMKPISGGGVLATVVQSVVPSDIESCQQELVKAWQRISVLQKEVNWLTKEVQELQVKRVRRVEAGRQAAAKQWDKD